MASESARVVQRCEEAKESRRLNLTQCDLRKFPDAVFFLMRHTDLQSVSVSDNALKSIPAKLGVKMTSITSLDVSHNVLIRLPLELKNLIALQVLNLSHNQFEEVPELIGHLPALTELNLSHNRFVGISSDELTACPSLKTVDLCGNPLRPESVPILESLVRVKVILD